MALQLFAAVKYYLICLFFRHMYSSTNAHLILGFHAFFSTLLSSLFYLGKTACFSNKCSYQISNKCIMQRKLIISFQTSARLFLSFLESQVQVKLYTVSLHDSVISYL